MNRKMYYEFNVHSIQSEQHAKCEKMTCRVLIKQFKNKWLIQSVFPKRANPTAAKLNTSAETCCKIGQVTF
ncbi:MAG: hypothetical protein Tsb009_22140 [Planctomycetaceae bacterium]